MALFVRVVFGAVFLVSGTLKLRDPSWREAAGAFGVPARLAGLVPALEVVVGAVIVAGVAPLWTIGVGLGLLAVFTGALASVMGRPVDQRPVCACFGRWSARPVDGRSLVRNLAFVALGVAAWVAEVV